MSAKTATNKSSGFSITTVIAALFVVVVVGFGGWTVLRSGSKDDDGGKTNSKTSSSNGKNRTSNSQKYLVIKQWGVQLPLSDGISDAYYIVSSSTHDPGTGEANTVWLSRASLDDTGCNANDFEDGGSGSPVGALLRALPDDVDPVTGTAYQDLYPGGVIVGKYYFGYKAWDTASCGSPAILQTTNAAFAAALSGLKKTN
ncbi:MAG TPA: hypothetical protein VLF62_02700 [Candidatus Saccharimonadales bacterium]|nr:hypothetical protein [Candidatus Saccharimonadales bacterium]